ncbi:hypothetical protein NDU88_001914 [Pleurodeles waltl]|uniref:Uncharacterized protein n=1 Tax=Pleurodeles waltl TaxID=8319 RepID=A0AAV7T1V1_PLEWA|nr:hypothetical protein NDU88_001914 [Pleurodeles waltl]
MKWPPRSRALRDGGPRARGGGTVRAASLPLQPPKVCQRPLPPGGEPPAGREVSLLALVWDACGVTARDFAPSRGLT